MFITKKHLSQAHGFARDGRVGGLAAARFDGAGADAAAQNRRVAEEPAGLHRDGAWGGGMYGRRAGEALLVAGERWDAISSSPRL